MMIKITEKCSMGCSHCMNDSKPVDNHMSFDMFKKVMEFQKKYGGSFCLISGGEPTEHPDFKSFLDYAVTYLQSSIITITTNGVWMQENHDYIAEMGTNYPNVVFQVSSVKEYYPTLIDLTLPVFGLSNVVVCQEIEAMYPMGRALDNNLEWDSKCSKCFNVRAITHQIGYKDLGIVIGMLAVKGKFCTPHIGIDGSIKLGESDLCPVCSNISKTNQEIISDILNFKCSKCNHINKKLSKEYLAVIGEV